MVASLSSVSYTVHSGRLRKNGDATWRMAAETWKFVPCAVRMMKSTGTLKGSGATVNEPSSSTEGSRSSLQAIARGLEDRKV